VFFLGVFLCYTGVIVSQFFDLTNNGIYFMAILRCPHCQFLKEVADAHLGKVVPCPKCEKSAKVVDTIKLVGTAVTQFLELKKNHSELEQRLQKTQSSLEQAIQKHILLNRARNLLKKELEQVKTDFAELQQQNSSPSTIEIESEQDYVEGYAFENQAYSEALNHFKPIVEWFKQRQIIIEPNEKASDISGYFDEIAVMLGDNLILLDPVLDGIRYRQRKGYDKFNLELNSYSTEHVNVLKNFCQTAYEFAFFSKYHFDKRKNSIFIMLNESPQIRHFFDGEWLEWYGFMKVASLLLSQKKNFSCLRSSKILSATSQEQNEIDIFFLIDQQPLWIECKSGEFRDSINKYQALRKRIGVASDYAILLVSGLEDEKATSMSSMFNLTIVNEHTLLKHVTQLLEFKGK
jgi:predicted nucleic-acid-binding Zn-ribbon protein